MLISTSCLFVANTVVNACNHEACCSRGSGGFLFVEHPFFNVGVELSVPSVVTNPTLTAIQSAINAVAKQVGPAIKLCFGSAGTIDHDPDVVVETARVV